MLAPIIHQIQIGLQLLEVTFVCNDFGTVVASTPGKPEITVFNVFDKQKTYAATFDMDGLDIDFVGQSPSEVFAMATLYWVTLPKTVLEFVDLCRVLDNDSIYDLFEDLMDDQVRDQVYAEADSDTPEPFRSAMTNLGMKHNVPNMINW